MSQYKITKEELSNLAHDIYEEACGGYLDLKEAICDKIVMEFIKKITPVNPPVPYVESEEYRRANEYAGPENNPSSWTYPSDVSGGTHQWTMPSASNIVFTVGTGVNWTAVGGGGSGAWTSYAGESVVTSSDLNVPSTPTNGDLNVSLRPQEYLRPNDYMGTNYLGNESERI